MTEPELLLKKCVHPFAGNINDWDFVAVDGYDVRVYYAKAYTDGEFLYANFYALKRIGEYITNHSETKQWDKDTCIVECLFNGIASWDAIRHIYFGDDSSDNYGYFYYPDIGELTATLNTINTLFPYTI